MLKFNAIIVDDDPVSQKLMQIFLIRSNSFNKPTIVNNLNDLKTNLGFKNYDVIFLDVELHGESGIDFLKKNKINQIVILITGNKNYALDAFDVEVEDFLLKPIEFERFQSTLEKIKTKIQRDGAQKEDSIFLKSNGKLIKTKYNDILFCESMADYIKIHTTDKMILVLQTMGKLEKLLPSNFVRCHRSYIINMNKIESISDRVIEIKKITIPISKSYYNIIKGKLPIIN